GLAMQGALNHLLASHWMRPLCASVFWLLIGALAAQLMLPPQLLALNVVTDQEQSEEEESEPAEVPGEEELPQFCGAAPCRVRRPDAAPGQRLASVFFRLGTAPLVFSGVPAEHASRNGTGGPLRC